MRKLTKILLPIIAMGATIAPMTCLASCSSAHFKTERVINFNNVVWAEGVSFQTIKEFDDCDIQIHLKSIILPSGIETTELFGVYASANQNALSIIIAGLEASDNLADGAAIKISLHLVGKSKTETDKVLWEEKDTTFKIIHDSRAN